MKPFPVPFAELDMMLLYLRAALSKGISQSFAGGSTSFILGHPPKTPANRFWDVLGRCPFQEASVLAISLPTSLDATFRMQGECCRDRILDSVCDE